MPASTCSSADQEHRLQVANELRTFLNRAMARHVDGGVEGGELIERRDPRAWRRTERKLHGRHRHITVDDNPLRRQTDDEVALRVRVAQMEEVDAARAVHEREALIDKDVGQHVVTLPTLRSASLPSASSVFSASVRLPFAFSSSSRISILAD